ncbi:TetR/AcrR family transcriptional regulator [Streptomyces sp. RKAG293]|uniref:TetR/AcrR family transcriptional regulator n=1 Tax=Streptomyces sp. RKAG293 TaxID=2893403 RepID=UPI002033436C|nr:TetR/AcrR family transcriptional regulator [Streptomyces sp. RKAG293]MCM2423589.1 TetR/AcrR family transcriptional regulator [Streptomyces sp. RKAG293]
MIDAGSATPSPEDLSVTGRPRPRAASHSREAHMLDAACAIFAEAGYLAATMEAIAARAHSTKPTLYAHFGSKEDLYKHCSERAAESLARQLFAANVAAEGLSLEHQVRAGTLAFFDHAAAHPHEFRLLFGSEASGTVPAARHRLMTAATDRIAHLIREFAASHGQPPWGASATLCASFIVGLAVEGARCALGTGSLSPRLAGEFATSFTVAALRHIDISLAAAVDTG